MPAMQPDIYFQQFADQTPQSPRKKREPQVRAVQHVFPKFAKIAVAQQKSAPWKYAKCFPPQQKCGQKNENGVRFFFFSDRGVFFTLFVISFFSDRPARNLRCDPCSLEFEKKIDMQVHNQTVHDGAGNFR